jgi:hypothetical protein
VLTTTVIGIACLLLVGAEPRTGCPRVERVIDYAENLLLHVFMKAVILGSVALVAAIVVSAIV